MYCMKMTIAFLSYMYLQSQRQCNKVTCINPNFRYAAAEKDCSVARREEAKEGELGGVWPGSVWGGGRKPGRVSQEGCGQGLSGEEGGSQGG